MSCCKFFWIFPSDGPLFARLFATACVAFVNCTLRIDPKTCVLALCLWNTQPNCRTSFNIATAFSSPPFFFFWFFARLTFNLPVCRRALITEFTIRFRLFKLTFGRMPIIVRWFGANTFQVISARLSSELPRWTPASEVLFPSMHLGWWFSGWSGFCVSVLHAYLHRAGNYTYLLSNTVLLLSIDSISECRIEQRLQGSQ